MKINKNWLLLCLGTLACQFVYAMPTIQDSNKNTAVKEYAAQGMRLGSFELFPVMGLRNEYDSNIFKRDKQLGETGSYIAHFSPGFTLKSDWARHFLELSLNTDITVYSSQPDNNNYHDTFTTLSGRYDVARDSYLQAEFGYDTLHGDRGSPDQAAGLSPTFYDKKKVNLKYYHKFNRLSLKPEFEFARFDYKDTPSTTGISLKMSTRNHYEYTPSFRLGYEIKPGYEAFSKFVWREVAYDTAVRSSGIGTAYIRDSRGYNILAGMAFDITKLIEGDISIGYLHREYTSLRLSSISAVNGFINISWMPTPLTKVIFGFSRDISETTQNGVAGVVHNKPSITIEHELMRNIIISLKGNYSRNEYRGFNSNNPVINNRKNRLENVYGANTGVKYLLNQNLSLGLKYTYLSRDVNYLNSNYEVHKLMFNINGKI